MTESQKRIESLFAVKSHGGLMTKAMQVKDVDLHKRKVAWVGNTYNYLDSDSDVLMDGCAAKSIKEWGPQSKSVAKIKHALGHDLTQLPGKILELEEGEEEINGVKCKCLKGVTEMANTTLGDDTLVNYQEGIYDNHSIGFQYMTYDWAAKDSEDADMKSRYEELADSIINPEEMEGKDYILRVHEIKLYEVSTVAFGANKLTPYLGSKSMNPEVLSVLMARKIKKLMESIKKGTQSDDMIFNLQVQCKQLEQLSMELFGDVAVKDSLLEKYKPQAKAAKTDTFKKALDNFTL